MGIVERLTIKHLQAMTEKWFPIEKVNGRYEISSIGRIKSVKRKVLAGKGVYRTVREMIRKIQYNNKGYPFLSVKHNGGSSCLFVHIEMAKAFIPNPMNKPEINHKDGNPRNTSIENIEWATRSENVTHSYRVLGRVKTLKGVTGSNHPSATPIVAIRVSTGERLLFGSKIEASKTLKIPTSHIYKVMHKEASPTKGFKFQKG